MRRREAHKALIQPFSFVLHACHSLCCWQSASFVMNHSCKIASHDSIRVVKAGAGREEAGQGSREPGEAGR